MTVAPAMMAMVVDTETTSAVEPQVIEFARAEVTARPGPEFTMGEPVVERFKPSKPIELGALATHHILPEELECCPPTPDRFDLPRYIIGHHVDFDWAALGSQETVKRIDTEVLARAAWPTLDSHRLGALIYHLFPPVEARSMLRDAHSAAADISNCFEVFKVAVRSIPTETSIKSWGDVWRLCEACRVPKILSFGKHKGKPIAEVPRDYAEWYARQDEPDPYLVKAFQIAGHLPQENAV